MSTTCPASAPDRTETTTDVRVSLLATQFATFRAATSLVAVVNTRQTNDTRDVGVDGAGLLDGTGLLSLGVVGARSRGHTMRTPTR